MNLFDTRPSTQVHKGAILSECQKYRYRLWRTWNDHLNSLAFVALNPSTADADIDDRTIRRMVGFAKSFGFDGIEVVNLFAFRLLINGPAFEDSTKKTKPMAAQELFV